MLYGEHWVSLCLFRQAAGSQGQHHACDVLVNGVGGMLASERQFLQRDLL